MVALGHNLNFVSCDPTVACDGGTCDSKKCSPHHNSNRCPRIESISDLVTSLESKSLNLLKQ